MIIESKKFFFKKADVYSDDQAFERLYRSGRYSSIVAVSYNKISNDFLSPINTKNLKIRPKTVTCVDLKLSTDDIIKKFNDTAQKHVKRALKNPDLTFNHAKNPNDNESYATYKRFEYSQGRVPISRNEFSSYRLFTASYKREQISGISLVESFPNIRTITIYSKRLNVDDKELYKIIAQSSRALVYKICLWAKEEGFKMFDLGSINTVDPKKAGITDFKLSFGGEIIPEYTYIYKSNSFIFFERFATIKVVLKRILFNFKKVLTNR